MTILFTYPALVDPALYLLLQARPVDQALAHAVAFIRKAPQLIEDDELAWLWFNRKMENWPTSVQAVYQAKRLSAAHFLGHWFFRAMLGA